jgi:hypothetical protein
MKVYTLSTRCFGTDRHTAENIREEYRQVIKAFNLSSKTIEVVRDKGANVKKACQLERVSSRDCLGHNLHNLLMVDGFPIVLEIDYLISRCRQITSALRYRGPELAREYELEKERLEEQNSLNEMIDVATEVDEYLRVGSELPILESTDDMRLVATMAPSLRKDMPTRWSATKALLDSVIANKVGICRVLKRMDKRQLVLDDSEWELLGELATFLSVFRETVEVMEGELYPTLGVALLCRAEIEEHLVGKVSDSAAIKILKQNLKEKLNFRFPIDDYMIGAALLDCEKFQLTAITQYLEKEGYTDWNPREFLVKLIQLHVNKEDYLVFMQQQANSNENCELETSSFCITPTEEQPHADMDMEAAETTTTDSKVSFANIEVLFSRS